MIKTYDIRDFYLFLKLDIWKSGMVNFFGYVENLPASDDFLFPEGTLNKYDSASLIKRHLDIGLYLLDIKHISQNLETKANIYHAVIAVCRNDMQHLETLKTIRIINHTVAVEFYSTLANHNIRLENLSNSRATYNRRSRTSLSKNVAVGSGYIQH